MSTTSLNLIDGPARRRPRGARAGAIGVSLALAATMAACGSSSKTTAPTSGTAAPTTAAVGSSSGSAAASSTVDLSKVTLNVGEEEKNVVTLLTAAGLQNTPYKIVYSEWPTSAAELQGLTAGAADVGGAAASPTINAIAAGAPIQATAAEVSDQATGSAILVPQNSPIRTVAQLKGKEVSPTTEGSIGEYVLLANLNKVGLSASDVKLDFLVPTDARAAFSSGDVAAWSTWDPYLATAEIQDHARVLATGAGLNAGISFLDATNSAINNPGKHAAIQDLINRLAAAEQWEASHLPAESADLLEAVQHPAQHRHRGRDTGSHHVFGPHPQDSKRFPVGRRSPLQKRGHQDRREGGPLAQPHLHR